MGDALEDDFDQDEINNYENRDYDSEEDEEDQNILEEEEEEREEENKINEKKKKRKKKFEELKLKKKSRNENEEKLLSSSSSSVLTTNENFSSSKQLNLLTSNNNNNNNNNLLLNESNFLEVDSFQNKKNYFVYAMEYGINSFRELIHNNSLPAGSPYVVIVCSGAKRAASVINTISKLVKCKIGKLFAKHFKVQDQVVALRQSFPIVVGTPNRLSKLIELGALSLSETKLVLVDLYLDSKSYSILDLPEVSVDFYNFISNFVQDELNHLQLSLIQETNVPASSDDNDDNHDNNNNDNNNKNKKNNNSSKSKPYNPNKKFKSFKNNNKKVKK